ncbi:MAG TPA: hypothetical protein VFA01_07820 [Candidatus Dormibacteraeota bacterium]|jgi:hypothetical protein|nr:hypothetical protein [Candidatus Dormibacteraeota bacterium]
MRRLALPLAVVAGIVLVMTAVLYALGRAVGVGPFSPGAPTSWVFTAISRTGEEGDAREVEVIDLASGERQLFGVDDRIFEMALSHDRRTLYVGTSNGRVFELDALRGTYLGLIRLSAGGDVRRLVVPPNNDQLVAVTTAGSDATAALIDLGVHREKATLPLGNRLIGPSVAGRDVVLSSSDRATFEQLLTLQLDPFAVRTETQLTTLAPTVGPRTAGPVLALARDGAVVALSPVGLQLRVMAPGTSGTHGVDVPLSFKPVQLVPGFDGDLVLGPTEVIHLCVGTAQRGERYVAPRETLAIQRVGAECGHFARLGDGRIYLAIRGKPELRELDPITGALKRTLALAGYPQRVAY